MMGHHDKVEKIRSFVRETLIKLGAAKVEEISETMLIRDGFFCGWRFEAGTLAAVWFVEEAEVKFLSENGAVLQVADLSQVNLVPAAQRAA